MRTACEGVAVATLLGLMVAGCRGEGTAPSTAAPVKVNAEALDVADGRGFPYRDVSAGYDHTCGVTRVGAAYCWGDFSFGALGIGPPPLSTTRPLAVVGGHSFASLSAGALRTCGVTLSGEAYCWGRSDGTTANSESPVAVAGGLSFATVSTGFNHTCGVTRSGEAYCWGDNRSGQLGDGTTASSATPVAVAGGLKFGTVSVGGGHTCGVTRSGETYCWGDNRSGQLGDGTTANSESPVAVAGGLSFATVSTGGGHTCGVTRSGEAYCWGDNRSGQLGDGTTVNSESPVAVAGGLSFATVSAGRDHTCGVTWSGEAYCWGDNGDGEIGNGEFSRGANQPVAVVGGLKFGAVSAGGFHTCGVTLSGGAYCWGDGDAGQLGFGGHAGTSKPLAVSAPVDLLSILP